MINKYMYYTIYKVTNKINGKIYIGSHKTKNINDNYMGSGKYLNYSINKHGIENFDKEILYVFNTAEEMYAKEAELVNEEFIAESNTYNLKVGGFGGFDYINTAQLNNSANNGRAGGIATAERCRTDKNLRTKKKKIAHNAILYRVDECRRKNDFSSFKTFKGCKHTEEAKAKIGAANAIHQKGKKNSQYGTCWVHNNSVSKKIKQNDLQQCLDDGWIKGRKI